MKLHRSLRYLALRLVAAALAVFTVQIRGSVQEMGRAWRRAYGLRLLRLYGYAPMAGGATRVASRSPLFYRSVPGGPPSIIDVTKFSGNVFYVDSAVGTDSAGYGSTPDAPLATIDYAIGLCTANQGDLIFVLPGHAETVAALITCDKAGVQIIGMGQGNDRPALTVSAVIDGITITAADVTIEGLRFVTPSAAATAVINVAAARAKIRRCRFELGANVVDTITITAAGEEPLFEDNEVVVTANGPDSWLKFEGVVDRPVIRRNLVVGSDGTNPFDDGVIDFDSVAITNPMIYDNYFDGGGQATTVLANIGAVVGGLYGPNYYGGSATNADNVPTLGAGSITSATFAAGAIDAAAIAANAIGASEIAAGAIDAATFAAGAIDAAAIANGAIDAATFAAGAIDAAAIANGAIDAATFAAGAIDAAAIANGAIDAATFAAGAIDAAAIAAAAIDAATFAADALQAMQDEAQDALQGENLDHVAAVTTAAADMTAEVVDGSIISRMLSKTSDTSTYDPTTDAQEMLSDKAGGFSGDGGAAQDDSIKASLDLAHTDLDAILADTGTDGVVIGADAITAAKIADNALATEHFALSAGEKTTDGIIVTRATAALPQSTSADIFTVTGLVLLKRLVGYVTTAVGAFANATKLKANSTGVGATTDICGTLDINAAVADTRLEITGTFANAMVATIDVPLAKVQVTEVVIPPGSIMLDCAGSDGGGGRIRWSATYVPLEAGAQIVAA